MLFKSFTGLTVKEFDDIYDRGISKRYGRHVIRRLSYRKDSRERFIGAGRHFQLDVKDRFLMLLVYCRLCITYTLAGFLFDLDQSNICRDMQKIEPLVRECVPIPQKMHRLSKRLSTPENRLKSISQAFCPSPIARNSRYHNLKTGEEERFTIQARRKHML